MRLDQAVLISHANDGDFPDRLVLQQAVLHLLRRQPLAGHLQHVVGPPGVGEVAVLVPAQHVFREVPLAVKGSQGLLAVVPVAQGPRVSPDPQIAHLAGGHFTAGVIAQLDLEPRHHGAEGARLDRTRAVGQEDVPHLGGAESVQQFHAEQVVPPAMEFHREGLSRRSGQPDGGEIGLRRPRVVHQVIDHGRHVDQDGRAELLDTGQ